MTLELGLPLIVEFGHHRDKDVGEDFLHKQKKLMMGSILPLG
jgi:hypothetical protein